MEGFYLYYCLVALLTLGIQVCSAENIFRRPPPGPNFYDDDDAEENNDPSATPSRVTNLTDLFGNINDNPNGSPCEKGICQSLQREANIISHNSNNSLTATLLGSLDLSSYCHCPDAEFPPMMCGNLCSSDDDTLRGDQVIDKESDLTCGEVQAMAPYIQSVQICPIFSALAPLCCTNDNPQQSIINNITQADENSCDLCNTNTTNNNQSIWLPVAQYSDVWAQTTLCPTLTSLFAQQSECEFPPNDRYTARSIWALPVHLSSLCCNHTTAFSEPFCPSGTIIDPDKPLAAEFTCGGLQHLLPHIADQETVESLFSYRTYCCREEVATRPPGSIARRVNTSFVIATETSPPTTTQLDTLQEAWAILVDDLVEEAASSSAPQQQRWLRSRSLQSTILDPTSPQITNLRETLCPSYWSDNNSNCSVVDGSYDLWVIPGKSPPRDYYLGLTNAAIDQGLLYQALRQVHPATTLAILGTLDTAYSGTSSSGEESGEDSDSGSNSNKERNSAFALGMGLGIAVALIGGTICYYSGSIYKKMAAQRDRYVLDPLEFDDKDHPARTDSFDTSPTTPGKRLNSPTSRHKLEGLVVSTPIDNGATPLDSPRDINFYPDAYESPNHPSPPQQASVSKALFQPDDDDDDEREEVGPSSPLGDAVLRRMVETELLERMEECTSVVDSSASSSSITSPGGSSEDGVVMEESPERGTVNGKALVSGDWQEPASSSSQRSSSQRDTSSQADTSQKSQRSEIVFETLASGEFLEQGDAAWQSDDDDDPAWKSTSISSDDDEEEKEEAEEEGSRSTTSTDLASNLCFQGQSGHIGFESPGK